MTTFGHRKIKAKRKPCRCSWCGEMIEKGEPAESWVHVDVRDFGAVTVHPECAEVIEEYAIDEGGEFTWTCGDGERPARETK